MKKDGFMPSSQHPAWWKDATELPPFSPKTWPRWAAVAWKIVNEATAGKPEQEPVLLALQSLPPSKESKYSDVKRATTAKAYQKAIREALEKAFRKIAGQNPSAT